MGLKYAKNMDRGGEAEVLRATTKKVVKFFWDKTAPPQRKSGYAYASSLNFCGPQCKILATPLAMMIIIDREFEFYDFFSFLKFNEFYDFFSVEKNSVKMFNWFWCSGI